MPAQSRLYQALPLASIILSATAAPCDIYASGGTPCVAAHGTTRALYDNFSGSLYQVQRNSDGATTNIAPVSAGGVANAAAQDKFCSGTTCLISIIYDQSGNGNHLTQAPPGGAASGPDPNGYDTLAAADGAPVTINGNKAYGVFIQPYSGYRNNKAVKTATGDAAEGLYALFDGHHYNGACCFDYGNAETSSDDTGNGHMEALYFGTGTGYGTGTGNGPWVLADLENGLYSQNNAGVNQNQPSVTANFFTGLLKGKPGNHWSLRGGDATAGSLSTWWNGTRPTPDYNPMSKEGAIILGTGGDNSNGAQGTFFEGAMTSGYPSDATENKVQANIQAQKYIMGALTSGPALTSGSTVTFKVTTPGYTNRYIAHDSNGNVNTQVITSSSASSLQQSGKWIVHTGFANSQCFSFESADTRGSYIRHYNYELEVNSNDGSKQFGEDATFCPRSGLNGQGNSLRSWSYPTRYWRHYNAILYIASDGGFQSFDAASSYNNDISFIVGSSFQASS